MRLGRYGDATPLGRIEIEVKQDICPKVGRRCWGWGGATNLKAGRHAGTLPMCLVAGLDAAA